MIQSTVWMLVKKIEKAAACRAKNGTDPSHRGRVIRTRRGRGRVNWPTAGRARDDNGAALMVTLLARAE